ncbi:MAG: ATP-dependent helicase [Pseudolysinimonas sp.]|uniref:ATP-dependent helicase n=1 Tax=Pseudolysinimonas sp. TaxID=2680009 RepID=UPI00326362C7
MADPLAALDVDQRRAAETLLGPVCILAGAGTGKTRAITARIAHGVREGVYTSGSLLALTFTTKAAGELRQRLRALDASGAVVRTFHAEALAQVGYFWPDLVGGGAPRLLDNKARTIGEAGDAVNIKLGRTAIRDVASEIEWRKTSELSIERYAIAARDRPLPRGLDPDAVATIQQEYERLKDERRRIDFEDVLLLACGMLDSEAIARERVRAQYRFFVVDEYQDVSPLQHRLLTLWLGPRTDLCVVGDANQTIYTFAGASSRYLLSFESDHPGAEVVRLERNYRSAPQILDVANRLMRGRPGALELRSATVSRGVFADPVAYDDDGAEASAIADSIASQLAAGTLPEQIAVLYRVHEQAGPIEEALAARGIVVRLLGGTTFFEIPAVRKLTSALAVQAQRFPEDPVRQFVADTARAAGWTVDRSHSRLGRDDWAGLDAIVRFAECTPEDVNLARFAAELEERETAKGELPVRAVVLGTLHSAKGLEWESVHLAGLTEGLLPVVYAKSAVAIDEERRLLYVGITRARLRLSLSWSRRGARSAERQPSRFLQELRTSRN